jgi:hypothetical protein
MNLSNNPVWDNLDKLMEQINSETIFKQHLEDCDYKIGGYYDGDNFYEEISFPSSLCGELESIFLILIKEEHEKKCRIKLKFMLKMPTLKDVVVSDFEREIGELVLTFNSDLEFLDENWLIRTKSPFITTRRS